MKKILGVIALLAGASFALQSQEASEKPLRIESQEQLTEVTEQLHQAIRRPTACSFKGQIAIGQTINSSVTSNSCISVLDNGDILYADFYTFTALAGHTYQVSAYSGLSYLATIQDYSSATVLASSGTCGLIQNSCTFTYKTPSSGTYVLGFGAVNSTGSYSIGVFEGTSPAPTPTRSPTPAPTVPPRPTAVVTPSSTCRDPARLVPIRGPR